MNFEEWGQRNGDFSVLLLCREEIFQLGINIQPGTQKSIGDPHKTSALGSRERQGESY